MKDDFDKQKLTPTYFIPQYEEAIERLQKQLDTYKNRLELLRKLEEESFIESIDK